MGLRSLFFNQNTAKDLLGFRELQRFCLCSLRFDLKYADNSAFCKYEQTVKPILVSFAFYDFDLMGCRDISKARYKVLVGRNDCSTPKVHNLWP